LAWRTGKIGLAGKDGGRDAHPTGNFFFEKVLDRGFGIGYKSRCRWGGVLTEGKQTPHKELDSGGKIVTIAVSKTCSLKTK
jgi:hypothetical protein